MDLSHVSTSSRTSESSAEEDGPNKALLEEQISTDYRVDFENMTPKERFDALGPDHWMVSIDKQHHMSKGEKSRRLCYDTGAHGGTKEPGYYKSMTNANVFVAENLGESLSFDSYVKIHKHANAHSNQAGVLRGAGCSINLREVTNPEVTTGSNKYLVFSEIAGEGYKVTHKIEVSDIQTEFANIMDDYGTAIRTAESAEEKLRVIAQTHLSLECLHAFSDGNARTHKLILNKLLAENNLDLCILNTPLGIEGKSLTTWIAEIKEGQLTWRKAVSQVSPESKTKYIEKKLKHVQLKTAANSRNWEYLDSDTSSSQGEKGLDERQKLALTGGVKKLENSSFKEALDEFEEANLPLSVIVQTMFDVILPKARAKEPGSQELLRELILHFRQTRGMKPDDAGRYEGGSMLHFFMAEGYYELFILNKARRALTACEDYLQKIERNSPTEEELEKIRLLRERMQHL
ncbi:MAG: Fic family protein [Bdellovibrionota bacterium]